MGSIVVACLGDSITAGSPLWDPDPQVRARIGVALDERSQWEWWAGTIDPRLDLRNHGVKLGKFSPYVPERLRRELVPLNAQIEQGKIVVPTTLSHSN